MSDDDNNTTEWGAHGQNVQRLIDNFKKVDLLSAEVFSGNYDSRIPEFLSSLNVIRKLLNQYMNKTASKKFQESFKNAITYVRAVQSTANMNGFKILEPFKTLIKQEPGYMLGSHSSLLPFLYEADDELGQLMERIGLGFKASESRQTVRQEESLMMGLDEEQIEEFWEYIQGNRILLTKNQYKKLKERVKK